MKNRFVAFLLMLVMIACSVYIGGYRSLNQWREDIESISDTETYNMEASEFNKTIQDEVVTNFVADIIGVQPLNLK